MTLKGVFAARAAGYRGNSQPEKKTSVTTMKTGIRIVIE
jgi:hypothetical protein